MGGAKGGNVELCSVYCFYHFYPNSRYVTLNEGSFGDQLT